MTPYFHPFLTGLDGGDIACNAATNNQQIFLFYVVSVIAISSALAWVLLTSFCGV
jgi:hypothetical protein